MIGICFLTVKRIVAVPGCGDNEKDPHIRQHPWEERRRIMRPGGALEITVTL
jgi:hypothetical protein